MKEETVSAMASAQPRPRAVTYSGAARLPERAAVLGDLLDEIGEGIRSACMRLGAERCALWARNPATGDKQLIVTWQRALDPTLLPRLSNLAATVWKRSYPSLRIALDPKDVLWGYAHFTLTPGSDKDLSRALAQLPTTLTPMVASFVCRQLGNEGALSCEVDATRSLTLSNARLGSELALLLSWVEVSSQLIRLTFGLREQPLSVFRELTLLGRHGRFRA